MNSGWWPIPRDQIADLFPIVKIRCRAASRYHRLFGDSRYPPKSKAAGTNHADFVAQCLNPLPFEGPALIIYPDLELRKVASSIWFTNRIVALSFMTSILYSCPRTGGTRRRVVACVDLDAVFNDGENTAIINEIIRTSGCPVQVDGAIGRWKGA